MKYKLVEEIIKLSHAEVWDEAKIEWTFTNAYQSNSPQTCLCGHHPIKNICVITNKKNGTRTEVGNCCVENFFGISEGGRIIASIKRLKDDISSSMSIETVEFFKSRDLFNDFEYTFYKDIIRKRTLTKKQRDIKVRINRKFLDFTSQDTNIHLYQINAILEWARKNTHFDSNFILSLKDKLEKSGRLTEAQVAALEKIIRRFKINV